MATHCTRYWMAPSQAQSAKTSSPKAPSKPKTVRKGFTLTPARLGARDLLSTVLR